MEFVLQISLGLYCPTEIQACEYTQVLDLSADILERMVVFLIIHYYLTQYTQNTFKHVTDSYQYMLIHNMLIFHIFLISIAITRSMITPDSLKIKPLT